MGKIAFIFPGQGTQYIGMGRQIANEYRSADDIFSLASEVAGFDLKRMVFEGDEETLKITENTQPSILTASIACMQPLLEKGVKPDAAAGLSLGEYTAHVLSGTLNLETAVPLVKKRGKYMQEAVPLGAGTMAAVLGLENDEVIDCCKAAGMVGIVEPANFNCPGQVVIAGEVKAVEKAVELAKEKGAKRSVILPVSAPFHCSMLIPAGAKLAAELDKIELNDMGIPVAANVTGEYLTDRTKVRDALIRQVSSPVLWDKCVRNMIEHGVDVFVEIGPGKVLSGFVKKISKDVRILNVEDIESLNRTMNEIGY